MKRKTRMFDKEYIESANKKIWQVLNDEKEYDDWTQICFSMKDAVQAAADIYECLSEIEIHKLFSFFREMVYKETENIQTFDITFKKKEGV